jgi:RsiW-degrading membrane proteinase PrsW (M82 family)
MDVQSPVFIALATAVLTAIGAWVYAKFVLKDPNAEKVLAKTALSGLVASLIVVLFVRSQQHQPSLAADPFFAPVG